MQNKDLRVGNIVKDRNGRVLVIDWFERDKVCRRMEVCGQEVHPLTEEFEYLQPIELSHDVLLACNCKLSFRSASGMAYYEHPMLKNKILEIDNTFFFTLDITRNISGLHTLQNAFYAATGEELFVDISKLSL